MPTRIRRVDTACYGRSIALPLSDLTGVAAWCGAGQIQAQTTAPSPLEATATSAQPGHTGPTRPSELPPVVVIGTTPLPGLGTALRDVPANVQTYGARDLAKQRQGNVTEFL